MSNNFFYILIICAFTEILTKNEEKKTPVKEIVKHTREFFEEEAKKDIENLLSTLKNHNISEDDEIDSEPVSVNAPRSNKIMDRIDEVLRKPKSKKSKQKKLRSHAPTNADNFKRGAYMQNSLSNLRNAIKSNSKFRYTNNNNHQFLQVMNRLAPLNSNFVKSRISGGHNVNTLLRNRVNHVNIKPEVYPLLITEDKFGSRETTSEEDIQISEQYYANDDDVGVLTKLVNKVDTKPKNESFVGTATIPMSENFGLNGILYIKRDEDIPTRKEPINNVRLHDLLKTFYPQPANHLRPGNRLENSQNDLDELEDILNSKDRDNMQTIILRSDVNDKVNPDTNERFDEFMKLLDIQKILRTSHGNRPQQPVFARLAKEGDYRSRQRRSISTQAGYTQAGYTQDPDTCKIYNENLVKLWSNLSKLINVTEQPNDRALHNIAVMIQAYLEHQNAKLPPELHKAKHEGPRDKISDIMLKIRKLLDEAQGSAEKITKIIIKYLKPDYTDVESEDCQEVNEENLGLSVDLLYKNYLENIDCQGEDNDMVRNKKLNVRERKAKSGKYLSNNGHMTLSLATSELKPKFQTILIEDEFYDDFHNGKIPRQGPNNKYRRVFKPSKKQRSSHAYRSGNQNEIEKLKTRSKASPKSASKKLKNRSLKTNLVRGRCEKSASRKLTVSLRPVMERFMGLLECQLDNTLRSVSFGGGSKNPFYLYASKFYSNEDSRRHRKISPRLLAKKPERKRNKSHKKLYIKRHDNSVENYKAFRVRDDESDSEWVRKYSFDQIKAMNSETPAVTRTDARVSDIDSNKEQANSDYIATYNEYFQSPPLYDDYDGVFKTYQVTNLNGFPSLINPLSTLNDKKNTGGKSTNKKLASSGKEQDNENARSDEYDTFYEDNFSGEPMDALNFDQQTESSIIETPFIDLTKLRQDDQLIEEKSKIHVKSFESLTDFLKRARDESLQTPEFAVPFALDTNKGYVELTHLIKYPKMLVYRPQFLVKNTMPYGDFLKTISNINMTNDEVRLMKIVRHLPDSSVQVLFETEDFEAPLEVRNLNDNRRTGSSDSVVNYQFKSKIDTANENTNAVLMDGDSKGLIPIYDNEARRKDEDTPVKSDSSSSDERLSSDSHPGSDTLRGKDELSPNVHFDYLNSDTNLTLNSKPNSSESSSWFSSLPSFSSGIFPKHPSIESGNDIGSAVGAAVGSKIGSGMTIGLGSALNLGLKLNPIHSSQLGSFFSKLLPSHSSSQATSNPSLNSQSHIKSYSDSSSGSLSVSNSYSQVSSHSGSLSNPNSSPHSLLPYTESSKQEVGNNFSSSTQSIVLRWWRKWKNIVKGKMKQIIGKLASLTNKIDNIG